jgi:HEAT repeat protein
MTYVPWLVIARLMARLTYLDEDVRDATVEALADRQEPGVIEALLGCLTDPDRGVRLTAIEALADRQEPGGDRSAAWAF